MDDERKLRRRILQRQVDEENQKKSRDFRTWKGRQRWLKKQLMIKKIGSILPYTSEPVGSVRLIKAKDTPNGSKKI